MNDKTNIQTNPPSVFTPEMIKALADGRATLLAHPDVVAQLKKVPDLASFKMRGVESLSKDTLTAMLDNPGS